MPLLWWHAPFFASVSHVDPPVFGECRILFPIALAVCKTHWNAKQLRKIANNLLGGIQTGGIGQDRFRATFDQASPIGADHLDPAFVVGGFLALGWVPAGFAFGKFQAGGLRADSSDMARRKAPAPAVPSRPIHRGLDGTQELIEQAAKRIQTGIALCDFGTQHLSYLAEAIKLLNRSWALVRATYGGHPLVVPKINDFTYVDVARVWEPGASRDDSQK